MSLYYPTGNCGPTGTIPPYSCNPCLQRELGRVRKIILVKKGYMPASPTSASQWTTVLTAKNAIFIPKVNGEYDGGETEEIDGFGDVEKENGATTHKLVWKDPQVKENADFYNAIKESTEYIPVMFTETQMWIPNTPCSIKVKMPITANLKDVVTFEATATWVDPDMPTNYTIPAGIFDSCFIVE